MLDAREIDIEIARLEYVESSYANYAKLADLYVIRDRMNRAEELCKDGGPPEITGISEDDAMHIYGDSNFLRKIAGKQPEKIWAIMDDLMDTLQVVSPKVYASVMRKIEKSVDDE